MKFEIAWDAAFETWSVKNEKGEIVTAFDTLLEAEQYVIERSSRSER